MQFAVLGTDTDALALLSAARSAGHEIVWLGDIRPEDAATLKPLKLPASPSDNWEILLDHAVGDAVICGRGTAEPELRTEQLKRLVTDAVPLLAVHPIAESVLTYYELDMVRRESGGIVRHYHPLANQPQCERLAEWVCVGHPDIGAVHQVACERRVADRSPRAVLQQLARDADLLRRVAGDIRSVSAVGPRPDDPSYAALQVQLVGHCAASLRWSVAPAKSADEGMDIALVGQHGTVRLWLPSHVVEANPAELRVSVDGREAAEKLAVWDAPLAAIDALAAAVDGRDNDDDGKPSGELSTWPAATQAMEIVDAVELSLQKGRTIEVHQQQLTEQLAFRGTMSAIGCGVLLAALLALLAIGVLGDLMNIPLKHYWPWAMLAGLAFFLLLQAVPLLVAKRKDADGQSPVAESRDDSSAAS